MRQTDLVRRLRNLIKVLQKEEVEIESAEWPGLTSVAETLVQKKYIDHADKEVRLHTVIACIEVLMIVSSKDG